MIQIFQKKHTKFHNKTNKMLINKKNQHIYIFSLIAF